MFLILMTVGATIFAPTQVAVADDRFGTAVAGLPDIDGDGVPDILIGDPTNDSESESSTSGRVWVVSGADGSVILQIPGPQGDRRFGKETIGLGSIRDGLPAFAVAASLRNGKSIIRAYAVSNKNAEQVYSIEGEWKQVTSAGDTNGDGITDIVAQTWRMEESVYVNAISLYSGQSGKYLHGVEVSAPYIVRCSNAGDVDDDGYDDLIVACGVEEYSYHHSIARIYSGKDGSIINEYRNNKTIREAPWATGLGDIDGDGCSDVIFASEPESGEGRVHRVSVYSSKERVPLFIFNSPLSGVLLGVGDVDGDGTRDIVVCDPSAVFLGKMRWHSGKDGSLLFIREGTPRDRFFGNHSALIGDVSGDGFDDLVVGAENGEMGYPGSVALLSGKSGERLYRLTRAMLLGDSDGK